MNYAIIDNAGLVINVVVFNGIDAWTPPEGTTSVEIPSGTNASIGWSYVDGAFVPPVEVPIEPDQQTQV